MESGLYIVATPIGNLGDISARALDVLRGADLVAAEDTRHSQRLLQHFGIVTFSERRAYSKKVTVNSIDNQFPTINIGRMLT